LSENAWMFLGITKGQFGIILGFLIDIDIPKSELKWRSAAIKTGRFQKVTIVAMQKIENDCRRSRCVSQIGLRMNGYIL
jgi:hypothetical protein